MLDLLVEIQNKASTAKTLLKIVNSLIYKLYNVVLVRARRIFSLIRDFLKGDIWQFIITIHGKVMFSQASVILFTGGCVADTPRPDIPSAQCMLGHTHRHPCPVHAGIYISPAVTAADGTHPTGMHSYLPK